MDEASEEHASELFEESERFMNEMNDWIEDASNRYKFNVAGASGVIQ